MKRVSPECKDLIKRILMPEDKRITIEEIYNHPWMKADLPNIPLELNFRRMFEYSKFSKVKFLIISVKENHSKFYSFKVFLEVSIKTWHCL